MKEIVDVTQDVKGRYSAAAEDRCPGQILPEGGHQHTLIKTVLHNTHISVPHPIQSADYGHHQDTVEM